jgi:hypothetical protein
LMKLTYWDLDWVRTRMGLYEIKYEEIYNELFDHITTAIEGKQNAGDNRSLQIIFQEVVDTAFGGYLGIEDVAKSHERVYKLKIKALLWSNLREYINFKSFAFTLLLILISFSFPLTKLTYIIMGVALFIAAMFPAVYAYIKLRRIKPASGKTSLIYSHVITLGNFPGLMLYLLLWLPKTPYILLGKDFPYKIYQVPPAMLAFIMALIIIYDLSCVRLCRQELKQFKFTGN